MPFIHRFLTPREERNMVYKTFSNAVMKQYPSKFTAIMGEIWKMPFEKLLRASLTTHHVNIYVDLAASKVTGVSQYDRYVKHVRRLSRVIGDIEDTPFVDLPRTDDVLMDHLFMKVCEFCPSHPHSRQTAETVTNELNEQGYIESRNDIVDMLEQPLLLQKRVRHIYRQIEGVTPPEYEDFGLNSVYPETASLTSIAEASTHTNQSASYFADRNSDSASLRSSASAIFTNNFDELFEQAAQINGDRSPIRGGIRPSSSIDYSATGSTLLTPTKGKRGVTDYSPQVEALHLEVVNETAAAVQLPQSPHRDLMKFSPGPRSQIKIVVEDGENDFDRLLQINKTIAQDSDSDEMLSSNPTSVPEPNLEPTVSSLDATMMSSSSRDSSYTRAETVLVSKTGDSSVQKRIKKRKKVKQQSLDASVLGTDDCSNCDVCDYEKRLSQMSLQNPTDEFDKLQQYMIDTGDTLPNSIDLPSSCDISVLFDPGQLEMDPDENFQPIPDILDAILSDNPSQSVQKNSEAETNQKEENFEPIKSEEPPKSEKSISSKSKKKQPKSDSVKRKTDMRTAECC